MNENSFHDCIRKIIIEHVVTYNTKERESFVELIYFESINCYSVELGGTLGFDVQT